jgi:undecaprenyl-diphosphatase
VNLSVFRAINHWPEWLSPMMQFFSTATDRGWFKILLLLMVLGMIAYRKDTRRTAIQALVAFPIANEMTDTFKNMLPMPRPFQELTDVILRLGTSDSAGTASAHSANMAAVAFVFTYHLKWWGTPWILVALVVGLSRIYCGMHYPYQVLLGWTCGALAGFVVSKTWDLIQAKRKPVVVNTTDLETSSDAQPE